jgi:hypothetical protein
MQWRAVPNVGVTCLDVAPTPAEIQLPQTSCTIQPGQCLTFAAGQPQPDATQHFESLSATNWQLPLLALRPHDSELRDRLTSLLAVIGNTKVNYMYEDQIRQLGPPGAVPLLAYVMSPESRDKPMLRIRAMSLVVELAPASAIPDLESLQNDQDEIIRKLATQALQRLDPDRVRTDT